MKISALKKKLSSLEKRVHVSFRNKNLLLQSMLHSSFVNENQTLPIASNERLEFLGDAVLELVISTHLMQTFPEDDEGLLSMKRAALVREATLAKVARQLRLQQFIILGHGEAQDGGHKRDSVLSDALEAFFGAVYLDRGLRVAKDLILSLFQSVFKDFEGIEQSYNFKNQLQQYAQAKYQSLPRYELIGKSGPEHRRKFKVRVYLDNKYLTWGSGTSIKKAEQTTSRNALNLIKRRPCQ